MYHIIKCVCWLFSVPTPPRKLKLVVNSSTSIRASWLEPLKFYGDFNHYVVMYGKASGKLDESVYATDKAYLITGLEEFTEYFVQVHAETSVSGTASNMERAKTLEDGKMLVSIFFLVSSTLTAKKMRKIRHIPQNMTSHR